MNSEILKNIFSELPKSQPRSRIMQAIVDANPKRTKLDARTKSDTYEDPVAQNDFAYGRSQAANILDQQQAEMERAERYLAAKEQAERERAKKEEDSIEQSARGYSGWEQYAMELAKKEQAARDQAEWNQVANEQNARRRDAMEQAEREQAVLKRQADPVNDDNIDPNARRLRNAGVPSATNTVATPQPQPSTSNSDSTSTTSNNTANNKTTSQDSNDSKPYNFKDALNYINNNPGYLMTTAIGQTLIAALLGRLLGGKTGMGLGAIMGLLASPLTASYLARNNYLSDIAKPFAETEKSWFNPNKSE